MVNIMPRGGHGRTGPLPVPSSGSVLAGKAKRIGALRRPAEFSVPPAPSHLDQEEVEVWRHYAPLLAADGRLTPKSLDVLARYCTAVVQVRALRAQLRASASIIVTTTIDGAGNERENVKANPLDAMLRQWMAAARALENDLVLNPASLLRVTDQGQAEDDPFAVFLQPDSSPQ